MCSSSTVRALSAAASAGLLALGLTACGGSVGGGDQTASATPAPTSASAPAATATSQSPEASETVTATPGGSEEPAGIEDALAAVMGPQMQVLTGDQLREASGAASGLTEGIEVTPPECGAQGSELQTALPDDVEMVGGLVVDVEDPAAPRTEILSAALHPDVGSAREMLETMREQAERCPSFTVAMGEGLSAAAEITVEDVDADSLDSADDALAYRTDITVSVEGASLPPGTDRSVTTAVYQLVDDTLYQYIVSDTEPDPDDVEHGVSQIEELRAQLKV